MTDTSQFCPGPTTRREFLRLGMLGLGGLTLPDLFRLRAAQAESTGRPAADTSVIYVWLPGGPPHMEMYDLKPDAPSDYRGEYSPIRSKVPGMDFAALLPRHAAIADKFNVVRSITHQFADHGGGHKMLMTGRNPKTPVDTVNDAPAVGSIVARNREHRSVGLPNYVCINEPGRDGIDVFAMGAAYLGSAYTPFMIPGDPSSADFKVPNMAPLMQVEGRLEDRQTLLAGFDRFRRDADKSGMMNSMDKFHRQAMGLLQSDKAKKAFDLSLEPDALRDRYGRHAWGQRLLMARRAVEAGCSFCTVVMENPYQSGVPRLKQGVYNWDSHAVNCHMYDDLAVRLPIYDQAVTALIEDIYNRGLDKNVLVVVTGEFGRTPRVNPTIGSQTGVMQPGRDHWPGAMSLICFGGGMRTGQVVGTTNALGEYPKDRPFIPADLWASVYRHLGIDINTSYLDFSGRPMPILPYGAAIDELARVS